MIMIYCTTDGTVILSSELSRDEARPELARLREEFPEKTYVMVQGDTPEECRAKAAEISKTLAARAAYMASLPAIEGREPTKEEWDSAMEKLSDQYRYKAANNAAHSWGYVMHPEGIIMIGHHGRVAYLYSGDTQTEVEAPKVCFTCAHTRSYFAERGSGTPLKCDIGLGGGGGLRKVAIASTCSGWKP